MYGHLGSLTTLGLALFLEVGAPPAVQGEPVGTDLHGDPLPAGAVARLGTERLRPGRDTFALAFSGDGKFLASVHGDAHVELWDAATGAHRGRLSAPASGKLRCLACSADGKYLAAGDDAGHCLWLWDLGTGRPPRLLHGPTSAPRTVAFSPDGRTLASAAHYENNKDADEVVRLWDSATGKRLPEITGPKYGLMSMAFLPGGKRLVGAGYDWSLRVWDVAAGMEVSRHDLPGRALSVQLLPDGKTVATLTRKDRQAVVDFWDVASGKLARRASYSETEAVGLSAAPTGNRLALFGSEGLRLLNAATGKVLRKFAPTTRIRVAAFAPDGRRLAAASPQRIHLWDAVTGKEQTPAAPDGRVLFARFLPGGRRVVTAHSDQTVRLWDAATGKQIRRRGVETDLKSPAFDLSPDGKTLALPHLAGNTVVLWNVARGKPRRTYRVGDFTEVLQFRFSPDGKVLAAASYQSPQNHRLPGIHEVHLMEVATGKVRQVLHDEFGPIVSLVFSPDSKRLVVTVTNDEYYWSAWDVGTGQKLHKGYHEGRPLFFLPDSQTLALGTYRPGRGDSGVTFWNLSTGKCTPRLPQGPSRHCLGVTPDRAAVVLSSLPWLEGRLALRDLGTGKLLARLGGHRSWVEQTVFSDDGAHLATVGGDNTVLVWDVPALRKAQAARRVPLSAVELQNLWQALGAGPPETTLDVFDRLVEAPRAAVAFLQERLTPVSDAGLAAWVVDLGSAAFLKRDQAMQGLRRMEFAAAAALKKVLAGNPPLELRRRVETLLKELEEPAGSHHLRRWRAVTMLEQIDSPAARRLLEALAKGAPAARLTREAQAALQRLAATGNGR
jgi:WD40 repeat protein